MYWTNDPKRRTDRREETYSLKRVNETLNDLREDRAARYEAAISLAHAMEAEAACRVLPSGTCSLQTGNW